MAARRPADLPDFEKPPVAEVVLSVQFEKLPGFRTVHVGLLWALFRENFPKTEEHPPLDPVFETFELQPAAAGSTVRVKVLDRPPIPRTWFLNARGTQLIQVQSDRFVHNWRKAEEDDEYPRYESILDAFVSELKLFAAFLEREGLGSLQFNQCEITYVNHMTATSGWNTHGELHRIIRYWNSIDDNFLPMPEDVSFNVRHLMPERDGRPMGRLHMSLQAGSRTDSGAPIYVLELTARGAPMSNDIEGVIGFLGIGREWIVKGFTAATTHHMHGLWRRKDVR